jgi:hypothetical protein
VPQIICAGRFLRDATGDALILRVPFFYFSDLCSSSAATGNYMSGYLDGYLKHEYCTKLCGRVQFRSSTKNSTNPRIMEAFFYEVFLQIEKNCGIPFFLFKLTTTSVSDY